ncbi:MAG: D-alanine--D-alanine ligase, partial [Candidatus Omnitrophica bacterium]|nr:D-alanine--D-alanine ligase [Candidatus Omnitrophota bacterium]
MGFRVGLTYNVKSEFVLKPGDPPDLNAEFDHEETVTHIERALKEAGHEVARIGNARCLLAQMGALKADIVFNIAEGYEGRNRESQVPILLEMMRIPFVGADGLTLGLTLDKVLKKKVLIAEEIPTP